MVHPTIYSFNAPYRGPKESKEVNKLFTSITYDISIVYDELVRLGILTTDNLRFCVNAGAQPQMEFTSAGNINSEHYNYKNINALNQKLNALDSIAQNILADL